MSEIDKLTELFVRFPGIGPRQARRFVYFLLRQDERYRSALTRAISDVVAAIHQCAQCMRYAALDGTVCAICADPNRDRTQLLIVEKDTDVDSIEKSGSYHGQYFVLGGALSLTQTRTQPVIRERELLQQCTTHATELQEIILALSATPNGEHTTEHLSGVLGAQSELANVSLTVLGRGLSTGSELEYADPRTLSSALTNRTRT